MKHLILAALLALGLHAPAYAQCASCAAAESPETRAAAERGDAHAQFLVGVAYMNGWGVERDDAQALVWYRKAAEQKHQGAQHKLGEMYENGQGVAKDYAEAAAWFRKLVEQGNRSAQADLDRLRAKSQGISNK